MLYKSHHQFCGIGFVFAMLLLIQIAIFYVLLQAESHLSMPILQPSQTLSTQCSVRENTNLFGRRMVRRETALVGP
jgi:hypothetical protein